MLKSIFVTVAASLLISGAQAFADPAPQKPGNYLKCYEVIDFVGVPEKSIDNEIYKTIGPAGDAKVDFFTHKDAEGRTYNVWALYSDNDLDLYVDSSSAKGIIARAKGRLSKDLPKGVDLMVNSGGGNHPIPGMEASGLSYVAIGCEYFHVPTK